MMSWSKYSKTRVGILAKAIIKGKGVKTMWIMLIKKLPTEISPPKLSIFWSTDWINEDYVYSQFVRFIEDELRKTDPDFFLDGNGKRLSKFDIQKKAVAYMKVSTNGFFISDFGIEHNEATGRAIFYKNEQIRVFDDEYSVLTHERMALYIGVTDEGASHDLIASDVAGNILIEDVLEGIRKETYDAALMDGCTESQAMAMALGIDLETSDNSQNLAQFPPLGWYQCKKEYAEIYCDENEMKE